MDDSSILHIAYLGVYSSLQELSRGARLETPPAPTLGGPLLHDFCPITLRDEVGPAWNFGKLRFMRSCLSYIDHHR